jgi:hypothetical protein
MNFQRIGFGSQLEESEKVERSFRRLFGSVFLRMVLWGGLFFAIGWMIWVFLPQILPFGNDSRWLVVLVVVFGILRWMREFWQWYGNVILMTNESIVFAEWKGFFDRKTVRLDYWDLDEVGLERKGAAAFLSGVGDLVFEKTNGGTPYIYKGASRPKRAMKILRHHRGRMLDEKNFTEESSLRKLLSQMVQTHVRKDGQPVRDTEEFLNQTIEKEKIMKTHKNQNIEVDFELDDDGGIEIKLKD